MKKTRAFAAVLLALLLIQTGVCADENTFAGEPRVVTEYMNDTLYESFEEPPVLPRLGKCHARHSRLVGSALRGVNRHGAF